MTTAPGSAHRWFRLLLLYSAAGFLIPSCVADSPESSAFGNVNGAELVGVLGNAGEKLGRVPFATLMPEGTFAFVRTDDCTIQIYRVSGTHEWSYDACRSTNGRVVGLAALADTILVLHREPAGHQLEKLWRDRQRGAEATRLMVAIDPQDEVVEFGESGQHLFVLLREAIEVTPGDRDRREERLQYELRELHAGTGAISDVIWTRVDTMFRLTVESRGRSWRLQAPFQLGTRTGVGGLGMFYWAKQRYASVEALNGDTLRIGPLAPLTPSLIDAEIRADSIRNSEDTEWRQSSPPEIRRFPLQEHFPPVYAILPAADGRVAIQRADHGILGATSLGDSTMVEIVAADTVTTLVLAPGFRARAFDGRHLVGVVMVAPHDGNREQPIRSIVVVYRLVQ